MYYNLTSSFQNSCFTEVCPTPSQRDVGLTTSPQADTASPAAKIFFAAFTSLLCAVLQAGQIQLRTFKLIFSSVYPQVLQRLVDGYHLSIPITVRPYHAALYSSCATKLLQPASEIARARRLFFCIFFTDRVSMAITWFSLISRVESFCEKSLRASAIFAYALATFKRAFLWLEEPETFFENRFCSLIRVFRAEVKFGAAISSPVDRVAKFFKPKSTPTFADTLDLGLIWSSKTRATWYLPLLSFVIVQVLGVWFFGVSLLHFIFNGSGIFAKIRVLSAHLKALRVYSADCALFLSLNLGYCERFSKKFTNAVCRCLKLCWTGMLLTSLSQACSGVFFKTVSNAEVSWYPMRSCFSNQASVLRRSM